ncbi:hypothetical protein EST38_g10020 [Candolleomyces aberdarensis]|uniref:Uncharacterized protein n=1 Tax=Candolleomyces aberdarensis TaxID=2316362 RepID=A0A4Q2DAN0_9AGAR|nr:hypothetical protein EST38_g10020 [Candolleomyces aberdarensis]
MDRLACTPHGLRNHEVDALERSQDYSRMIATLDERQEELSVIDQEKSRLLGSVNACQQALSPTNHLPDDILREIFLHLYLCFPRRSKDNSFSSLHPPIVTGQVCRLWRAVTHDFAALWTKLRTENGTQKWDHTGLELLAQWLQRAKGTPLNLQLVLNNHSSSDPPISKFIGQLTEPIGGSLTRLLLKYVTLDDFSHLSLLQLPSLEQLSISLDVSVQSTENSPVSFTNAPALRRASFSGSFDEGVDRKVIFPWNQLTHFIGYSCPDYCEFFLLTNLPLCTQLRFLSLELEDYGSERYYLQKSRRSAPTRTVVPSLETLALNFSDLYLRDYADTNPYPNVFFPFEFPNLRKLVLLLGFIKEDLSPSFLDELRRLKNLEHLSISIRHGDTLTPLRAILQALPHIKTLELGLRNEYTPIIAQLTGSTGPQDLLPNLHTVGLMFDASNPDHSDDSIWLETLTRFVESRTQPELATRLETITFFACDHKVHPMLDAVRQALRPFILQCLIVKTRRINLSNLNWIAIDPELEGRPELLELY